MQKKKRIQSGYTMIELIVTMVVIAVVAAVVIPTIGDMMTNAKVRASEREMMELVKAIVGDADKGFLGYLDEVGDWPPDGDLTSLYAYNNAIHSPYNPFTRTGWNGPYISTRLKDVDGDGDTTDAGGNPEYDVLYDNWGNAYVYDEPTRTVTSAGPNEVTPDADDFAVDVTQ